MSRKHVLTGNAIKLHDQQAEQLERFQTACIIHFGEYIVCLV